MAAQPSDSGLHVPVHPVRIVTASSLFDGHDASINIMRRIMQSQGAEVIHLGHNRSVQEVVDAAVEEDAQGVAVSSYQGGHVEYFEYLVDLLREAGAGHVRVVGGGGGVIVPAEIERLRDAGVTIFSPEDGQRLGLPGMVNQVVAACDTDLYTKQSEADANHMVSALLESGITASKQTPDSGKTWSVKVDEADVVRALAVLRAQGLPQDKHVSLGDMFKKEGLISSPTEGGT